MENSAELTIKRRELSAWIPQDDAGLALVAYYLLHHPANRVRLHLSRDEGRRPRAALAECVTGYDLFRPLIVMWAQNESALIPLMQEAMPRSRPCLLLGPVRYLPAWQQILNLADQSTYCLYALDSARFAPIINVLVVSARTADGLLRFEIRSPQKALAAASLNWRSPGFAEVNVFVQPEARGRHWGESVVSALCAHLLEQRLTPLYLAGEDNLASRQLAEQVGFRDTGRRFLFASALWPAGEDARQ